MRWVLPLLVAGGGCGFHGSDPDSLPGPDNEELVLATSAELATEAELTETFVSGAGGTLGPGTVEPVSWVPGKLLAELDDKNGPFDGTWAARPARAQLVNRGLMAPVLPNQVPPGATGNDYIVWMSGQLKLEAGVQRLQLAAATNAVAFADVLDDKGVLVHCSATASSGCMVTAPAAGWYTLHLGLRRPAAATSHAFELRWAAGTVDPLAAISPSRLRVPAHTEELAGWRLDLYASPRGMEPVQNGTALNASEPFALRWTPALLGGQNGSPHYRNAGQLRVLEPGGYDFAVNAERDTSVRLWLDGEWVGPAIRFDASNTDPPEDLVSRELTAGWHDVVLEAYKEGAQSGGATLRIARAGQFPKPPVRDDVRPLLGLLPSVATAANLNAVPLAAGVPVTRAASITGLGTSPKVIAVDVSFRVRPRLWTGLTAALISPAGVRATLAFPNIAKIDDTETLLHASVPAAQLGGVVDAQGTWTLEVTHPMGGVPLDGVLNVLKNVRINAHYLGSPQVAAPAPQVATSARYARVVVLPAARELRGLSAERITPAGSTIELAAQLCEDEAGTVCQPELSAAQLAADRPTAKIVKLIASFTSDGFASPILRSITLQYDKR